MTKKQRAKRQRERENARVKRSENALFLTENPQLVRAKDNPRNNPVLLAQQLWRRPGYRQVEPTSSEFCVCFDYNELGRSRHRRNEERDRKLGYHP